MNRLAVVISAAAILTFQASLALAGGNSDLSVTKIGLPDPVAENCTLTYTIVVSNKGPDGTSVQVTDTLPAGTSPQSNTTGCTPSTNHVNCFLPFLGNQQSTTITVTVAAAPVGSFFNTVTVSTGNFDPNTS